MGTQENARKRAAGLDLKNAALTATAPAAPAGGTGATGGAYDNATNRDLAIVTINTNRTRIGEIEVALQAAGILPA